MASYHHGNLRYGVSTMDGRLLKFKIDIWPNREWGCIFFFHESFFFAVTEQTASGSGKSISNHQRSSNTFQLSVLKVFDAEQIRSVLLLMCNSTLKATASVSESVWPSISNNLTIRVFFGFFSIFLKFSVSLFQKLRHHESRLTALCRVFSANMIT